MRRRVNTPLLVGIWTVMRWAREHGCELDEYMCSRAADGGHLGAAVGAGKRPLMGLADLLKSCYCERARGGDDGWRLRPRRFEWKQQS